MYVIQNKRNKNGKEYTYSFLAESKWSPAKQRSEKIIVSNISKLPLKTIETLKNSLSGKKNTVCLEDISIEKSIDYGYCFVILEIMKRLKIRQVISAGLQKKEKEDIKYVLLMILGKIVTRGSKLGIVNWIKRNEEIAKELGFTEQELNNLSEKQLYTTQFDINNIQEKIEKEWRQVHHKKEDIIYLYDITSFYFEGMQNELACFGYNRDKKQGKQIITVGLITNQYGFPLKIQVFTGNTKDDQTVEEQLQALQKEYEAHNIILVGDRGMRIRCNLAKMKEEGNEEEERSTTGIQYISGLTTPEIRKLEKNGVLQMSFFDTELVEIEEDKKRYILCVNPVLEQEKTATRQRMKHIFESEYLKIQKSFEKKKKQCEINRKRRSDGDKNKKLKVKLTTKEIEAWKYKLKKIVEKFKFQKIYTININGNKGEESFMVEYDALAYEELVKFDGKYVFETTVSKDYLSKEEVRDVYKQLQTVEHAFRDMKMTRLDVRPIFHVKEETTRSHVFLGMFSYAIIREMELKLFPWLKEQKKTTKNKISFEDAIEELKMIKLSVLSFGKNTHQEIRITKLNENQKTILSLLNLNEKILDKHN